MSLDASSSLARPGGRALLPRRLDAAGRWLLVAMPPAMWLANRSAPLMLALAAAAFLAAALADGQGRALRARLLGLLRGPVALALSLFMLWALVSIAWSHRPAQALAMWGELALPLGCGLVIAASGRFRADPALIRALAFSLIAAALLMSVELLGDLSVRIALDIGKQHGFVFNRPMLLIMLLCVPVLAALAGGDGRKRLLAIATLLAVAAAIVISDSGAAKLGLAVLLPVWLAARLLPRLVLGLVAAGFALAMLLAPVQGRLVDALMPAELHQRLSGAHTRERVDVWLSFGEVVRLRPLAGTGFNSSAAFDSHPVAAEVPAPARRMLAIGHPHSAPLQAWVETGFVGAALLTFAGLALLWRVRGRPARDMAPALGLFAAGFAVASTAHGAWQGWWIAGLCAACLWLAFRASAMQAVAEQDSRGAGDD